MKEIYRNSLKPMEIDPSIQPPPLSLRGGGEEAGLVSMNFARAASKFLLVSIKFLLISVVSTSFYLVSISFPNDAHAGLIVQRPLYLGLDSGLVGYWTFDQQDMAGERAYDLSGQGNTGLLTNGPVRKAGRIGQALEFDGVNDYVQTPLTNLNFSGGTISWWQRPRLAFDNTTIQAPWGQMTNGDIVPEFSAQKYSDGKWYVGWNAVGEDDRVILAATATNWPQNQWSFYTFTWVSGGDSVLYQNGVWLGSKVGGTTLYDVADNFVMGQQGKTRLNFFNGLIDDVRVYNRALSPDEIKRLYNIGATLKLGSPKPIGLDNGLVGYWTFDGSDMAGERAYDKSGQGNTGLLTNGPTRKSGRIGQALNFDGVNDYVNVASIADPALSDMTFSVWVKTNVVDSAPHGIMGWSEQGDSDRFTLYQRSNNTFSVLLDTGTLTDGVVYTITDAVVGQWFHLVATMDRDGNMVTYSNGIQTGSTGISGSSAESVDPPYDFAIGIYRLSGGGAGNYFNGLIDDVRVYNRALSPDEIKRLYNIGATLKLGSPKPIGLDNGLVGYWTFDGTDMAGERAYDKSGNNNTGLLTNGPVRKSGRIGQALDFDGCSGCGQDDLIDVLSPTSLDTIFSTGGKKGTIAAWIYPRSHGEGNWGTVVDKIQWTFVMIPTQKIRFFHGHSLGNGNWDSPTDSVILNAWNHVAVIYDGSSTSNDPQFFVNGVLVATTKINTPNGTINDDSGNLFSIGNRDRNTKDRTFDGLIDDVRIYNRALTSDEIKRLYNMGR